MRPFIFVLIALNFSACSGKLSVTQRIDVASFRFMGTTLFNNPTKVSLKELHLDSGSLIGRSVIIHGEVVSVGDFYSHLTLTDESARMLVVLTDIPDARDHLQNDDGLNLAILGSVERGKKGLPYVLARAIKPLKKTP